MIDGSCMAPRPHHQSFVIPVLDLRPSSYRCSAAYTSFVGTSAVRFGPADRTRHRFVQLFREWFQPQHPEATPWCGAHETTEATQRSSGDRRYCAQLFLGGQ